MSIVKLDTPYTMIVAGQTGSGKTRFVKNLILHQQSLHAVPFTRIVYIYSIDQTEYEGMREAVPSIEMYEGYPVDLEFDGQQTLLVLDDMMMEMSGDDKLARLFTRMRHKNLSTIFITQNLYFSSRFATTVTRNAQYLVLFPNVRDTSMISTLGRQIFPQYPKFLMEAFIDATSHPFGYLFVDLKTNSDQKLRVRSDVFSSERVIIYRPTNVRKP